MHMWEGEVPTSHPSVSQHALSVGAASGGVTGMQPEVLGAIAGGVLLVIIGAAIFFVMYQKRRKLRQKRAVELLALAYADQGKGIDGDDERGSRISAPTYFESVYSNKDTSRDPKTVEMYTSPPKRASARPGSVVQAHRPAN